PSGSRLLAVALGAVRRAGVLGRGGRLRLGRRLLLRHLGDGGDPVAVVQVHDADAERVPAHDADLVDVGAVHHPLRRHQHDVVAVGARQGADHQAVALAGADVVQALAAALLLPVAHLAALADDLALRPGRFRRFRGRLLGGLLGLRLRRLHARQVGPERGPLAVALLADRQQVALRVGDDHADHLVVALQGDAADAAGVAAHRPGLGLVEADGHALARAQDDLVARLRQGDAHEGVALVQADADDAARLGPA